MADKIRLQTCHEELEKPIPIPNGVWLAWAEAGYTPVDQKRQPEADQQSLLAIHPQRGVRARLPHGRKGAKTR